MPFRFEARTLLELGKELISSDEVALYELIKNGVDAGSPLIEITAEVVILFNAYREALEALDGGLKTRSVFETLCKETIPGISSDKVALFLDPVQKAIGSPRRFRAALRAAYRRQNWIEISDTGHGMSLRELDDVYLTIGTRSRRAANISGAQFLGDKGVGRLSAMRLGDRLTVTTTRQGDKKWNILKVDWTKFSHETEVAVSDIPIKPQLGGSKQRSDGQGTRVRISNLTADWDAIRFTELFHGRIARMVDPFEPGKANRLLIVRHNGARILIPSIPEKLLASAHASCHASLRFDGDEPVLDGMIDYHLRRKQRPIAQRGTEVYTIAQTAVQRRGKKGHAAIAVTPIRPKALQDLGPFDVDVYWYNRRVVDAVKGLTESIQQTRAEIARWAGGPMLYRHGFRILPYGDPDDDWLALDLNAFGQSGFKLNRQQVLGRIRVSSAHTALSEQTNREGLVRSEAADALRTIMMWLLHSEMRQLINEADKAELLTKREAESIAFGFRDTQKTVEKSLAALRRRAGSELKASVDELGLGVATLAEQCETLVGKTSKLIAESAEEREKFVHLAGIGLMTEFIFHELDRSVVHTLRALTDARDSGRAAALKALEAQLITLQKRISAFDELTGERRQTKSSFDLVAVVRLILENHENQFRRHKITVHFSPPANGLKVNAVRGMIIQILENLIANSTYWLRQQKRYEVGFRPTIRIDINPATRILTVEDNGPGVDPKRREIIFQPFVSSKPPGQGRGLGLYISRELAQYHGWELYLDEEIGRKRARRLSTFVLDMGGEK